MSDEYTPTTDEIRDYVEVGGEPQPWLPPTPDKDAARVAAFDRWLASVKAEAWDHCLDEIEQTELNAQQAREGNPHRKEARR